MNPAQASEFLVLFASLALVFLAVVLLVYSLIRMAVRGLQSYESKYVAGATRTLDAMYLTMTPQQILWLSVLSSVVTALLIGVSTLNAVVGFIAGAVGFVAPYLVIRLLKWRRDRRFGEQLVDALIGMGNALRAGHSLPAALELIAREMDNPMGQEMRLVVQEMRLGVPMEQALDHLCQRMPSEDLDILVTSIVISRQVGGNLAEIFDNIAHTIRERHRIEGKIASLTAQGKLQGLVIALLPLLIGVFLNAYSPDLMRPMFQDWLGWALIGLIVVLEAFGVLLIWRIVSIKV